MIRVEEGVEGALLFVERGCDSQRGAIFCASGAAARGSTCSAFEKREKVCERRVFPFSRFSS